MFVAADSTTQAFHKHDNTDRTYNADIGGWYHPDLDSGHISLVLSLRALALRHRAVVRAPLSVVVGRNALDDFGQQITRRRMADVAQTEDADHPLALVES